ncbi:MAG: isoquinoline 1-oxidoreductase alpha subunit [Gammaproteobacteria bacterium]|jgi:isoquinoline 1-oxidoreductase alpha subunit
MTTFELNGGSVSIDAEPSTSLLRVLREHLQLKGTVFGCGAGRCGACTVHLNGAAVRSCRTTLESVGRASVTTIEGLSLDYSMPLRNAWIAEEITPCRFCKTGLIMQAAALLAQHPQPSREQIDDHLDGDSCGCGTYEQALAAIERAAQGAASSPKQGKAIS